MVMLCESCRFAHKETHKVLSAHIYALSSHIKPWKKKDLAIRSPGAAGGGPAKLWRGQWWECRGRVAE
jgi:hypothetical protein